MVDNTKIRRQGCRESHHKNGRGKDPKDKGFLMENSTTKDQ
jgi:hypothetical protein